MRFLASSLCTTLILAGVGSLAMAQHSSGSGSGKHSYKATTVPDSATHRRDNVDAVLGRGGHHGGAAEELTRMEHQPMPGGASPSSRPKPLPKPAALPKLDSEKGNKGTAIRVSGHARSSKGLVDNKGRGKGGSASPSPGRRQ